MPLYMYYYVTLFNPIVSTSHTASACLATKGNPIATLAFLASAMTGGIICLQWQLPRFWELAAAATILNGVTAWLDLTHPSAVTHWAFVVMSYGNGVAAFGLISHIWFTGVQDTIFGSRAGSDDHRILLDRKA